MSTNQIGGHHRHGRNGPMQCGTAGRSHRVFKTITFDNGTEFHDYKVVEAHTGVKCYFATPYTRGNAG